MNKICSNCVLDTTISKIKFDDNGVCDFCQNYYKKKFQVHTKIMNINSQI